MGSHRLGPNAADLVAALSAVADGDFDGQAIRAALARVARRPAALAAELWAGLPWRAGDYTRVRLHRDRRMEVLAMAWAPGSASAIHDHAGQLCCLALLAGTLSVEAYDLAWPGDQGQAGPHRGLVRRAGRARLQPGDLDARGPADDIHRVHNDGPVGAASVHVYARPFASCLVYASDAPVARRQRLRLDGEWPVLG